MASLEDILRTAVRERMVRDQVPGGRERPQQEAEQPQRQYPLAEPDKIKAAPSNPEFEKGD